jgi:hypothetical protein
MGRKIRLKERWWYRQGLYLYKVRPGILYLVGLQEDRKGTQSPHGGYVCSALR